MNREDLFDALSGIDERFIAEACLYKREAAAKTAGKRTRTHTKRLVSLALAAALLLALGLTAYAVWNIHAAKQRELKADLRIEESKVGSYHEYDVSPQSDGSGAVLLATINDGDSQRVFVNVSPVEKDEIERFPESVAFAWKLDGMTVNGEEYWMTAGPRLKPDRSVSGHDAILRAVLEDAYDESTKTLTLACFVSNNAITQAQAYENSERVRLTLTLWDHRAQADAGVGSSAAWLESQKSFGSVWFTPTKQETRYFDFGHAVYHDAELDRDIELVGLELTPFSAVWKVHYEGDAAFHTPGADQEAYGPWSVLEDKVCIESQIVFSDGSSFSTGGALTVPYENGTVNQYCGWGEAIDIHDVQRVVLHELVLWEEK